MANANLILLLLAIVLSLLQAFGGIGSAPAWSRPHVGWLAMALYFLSLILLR
jgi:hypothetical protein